MTISMREILQKEMDKRKMNQQEISLLLGISSTEVSRYIHNQNPSAERLEYIADKLGYEVVVIKKHTKELKEAKHVIGEKELRQILEEYPGLGEAEARIILGVVESIRDEKGLERKRAATGGE